MRIRTWIQYEIPYIPPRCRKPYFQQKEEHVFTTLREVRKGDLQLAFEDQSFNGVGEIFYYKKEKTLWRKATIRDVCAGGEKEYGYNTALEALIFWNDNGSHYFFLEHDRVAYGFKTDRRSVMRKVRRDMHKYILVDGVLYIQTTVPFYNITTFGCGNNHGGTGLFVEYGKSRRDDFDALSGEEAVEAATKIALGRGDTNSVPRFHEMIVVHMPELVKRQRTSNR